MNNFKYQSSSLEEKIRNLVYNCECHYSYICRWSKIPFTPSSVLVFASLIEERWENELNELDDLINKAIYETGDILRI